MTSDAKRNDITVGGNLPADLSCHVYPFNVVTTKRFKLILSNVMSPADNKHIRVEISRRFFNLDS